MILDFAANIVAAQNPAAVLAAAGFWRTLIATNLDPQGCWTWESTRSSVASSEALNPWHLWALNHEGGGDDDALTDQMREVSSS